MLISSGSSHPTTRGALDEPKLNQVRLVHVLERVAVLTQRGSQGIQTHWTSGKAMNDGLEHFDVALV